MQTQPQNQPKHHQRRPPGHTEYMCTRCKVVKPVTDFCRDATGPGGHNSKCRSCEKIRVNKAHHDGAVPTVYLLRDPRDGSYFYIGSTTFTLTHRLEKHILGARGHVTDETSATPVIRDILARGLRPEIIPVAEYPDISRADLRAMEAKWLRYFETSRAKRLANINHPSRAA